MLLSPREGGSLQNAAALVIMVLRSTAKEQLKDRS
jgi:hypothetical protein